MRSESSKDMWRAFKDPTRYQRSGIVFAPHITSAAEELAVKLPADRLDWMERTHKGIRANQQWVLQEPEGMLSALRELAYGSAPFLCRLVENFDLVLARWSRNELNVFWSGFSQLAKNAPHPVILLLPDKASFLGPQGPDLDTLETDGLIVRL